MQERACVCVREREIESTKTVIETIVVESMRASGSVWERERERDYKDGH